MRTLIITTGLLAFIFSSCDFSEKKPAEDDIAGNARMLAEMECEIISLEQQLKTTVEADAGLLARKSDLLDQRNHLRDSLKNAYQAHPEKRKAFSQAFRNIKKTGDLCMEVKETYKLKDTDLILK